MSKLPAVLWNRELAATVGRLAVVAGVAAVALAVVLPRLGVGTGPVFVSVRPPQVLPGSVPAEPEPGSQAGETGLVVDDAQAWLRDLAVGPERPAFERGVRAAPGALCAAFAAAGWRMEGWTGSALGEARAECAGERVYPAPGDGGDATRSFAMLRGPGPEAVREMRMKLNLLDPATADAAARDAAAAVSAAFERMSWPAPSDLARRIAALEPFEAEDEGTIIRFWREAGEVPRYNLAIRLPGPLAIPDASRMAPRPGTEPAGG
ncbi:DUF6030 family protein [Aureimonas sp. AU12]|uniref:DUF6030 family protein n=1 Tax=Aureimonas sp. AU12 TaxID=1638161 RepID=UPI000705B489|nr:DUF6030 family protein [Aureimonas sp. AU12]BAT29698.1 hypothetical protein [Aureimonas sp. AU12]